MGDIVRNVGSPPPARVASPHGPVRFSPDTDIDWWTSLLLFLGRHMCYGERVPLADLACTCTFFHNLHRELLEWRRGIGIVPMFFAYKQGGIAD